MLNAVYAIVVCLSVRLSVRLQIMPHDSLNGMFCKLQNFYWQARRAVPVPQQSHLFNFNWLPWQCPLRYQKKRADCVKLRGHWTKSHEISTRCTEMIADYSAEIKIAIFQSVWKCQRDEWRSTSNSGQILAKIARFTTFGDYWTEVHQIWTQCIAIIAIERFESGFTIGQIHCPMPKQRAKVIPRDVYKHLPYLTGCHSDVPWATAKRIFGKLSLLICLPNL